VTLDIHYPYNMDNIIYFPRASGQYHNKVHSALLQLQLLLFCILPQGNETYIHDNSSICIYIRRTILIII